MLPGSSVEPDNLETSLQSLGFQVGNMSFSLPLDSFPKTLLHFPPGSRTVCICFGEKEELLKNSWLSTSISDCVPS